MRYNYKIGVTADRRGMGPLGVILIIIILVLGVGYGGLLVVLPSFGGWPVHDTDRTATMLRTVPPDENENRVLIPKINAAPTFGDDVTNARISDSPATAEEVTVSAARSSLGFTPTYRVEASPFYQLDTLEADDDVYIDFEGTRYAYAVTDDSDAAQLTLQTLDEEYVIYAELIGTVNWNDGDPQIETVDEEPTDAINGTSNDLNDTESNTLEGDSMQETAPPPQEGDGEPAEVL